MSKLAISIIFFSEVDDFHNFGVDLDKLVWSTEKGIKMFLISMSEKRDIVI